MEKVLRMKRNTKVKRKLVLHNKKRFIAFIVCFIVIILTVVYSTSVHGYKEPSFTVVHVEKGDTLWTIAKRYCSGTDIRKYIYQIKKINNLSSSEIYQGDTLLVLE